MSDPIKQNDEFDGIVQDFAASIVNMFRRKITALGYDVSVENYTDLRAGVEGALTDFGSRYHQIYFEPPRLMANPAQPKTSP